MTNLDAVQPNTIDKESTSSVPTDASALGLKVLVEGKNPIVEYVLFALPFTIYRSSKSSPCGQLYSSKGCTSHSFYTSLSEEDSLIELILV